jgi:hypothetical protein
VTLDDQDARSFPLAEEIVILVLKADGVVYHAAMLRNVAPILRTVSVALPAAALLALLVVAPTCHYEPPVWSECCSCACEGCDQTPDRVFAPVGDTIECWEACDEACAEFVASGCEVIPGEDDPSGQALNVLGCPEELCVEYVALGAQCDGSYGESGNPFEVCRHVFRECQNPDWLCEAGTCVET